MSRPEAGLEELRNAFDRAVYGAERRAWIIGLMGMQNTDGTMSLAVPDRRGFVFVTTGPSGNQIVTIARNDGDVPLRNKMPIRMKRADDGVLVIYGIFNAGGFTDSGMTEDYENNFGAVWHHHRIGSGLEFEWEALMLEQARAYPTSGMLAFMNPFRYYHGQEWKTFEGGTFDLTGYQPAGVGTHAWVIIGVNPEDSTAVAVTGPPIAVATDLTLADANDVDFVGIPVAAVKVRNDSSSIQDITLFKDVHEWFAGLHYSELGDLGNVNTADGYYGLGPYFNDELYYHGADGYDWLSGGHKLNMGAVKQLTLVDGVIDLADGPTFGFLDLIGEGSVDDTLINILNGQVGDMIVLHSSDPVANGVIMIAANADILLPTTVELDSTSCAVILMYTQAGWIQPKHTPVNYIDFNVDYADGVREGRLQWNIEDGTLEVGLPGGDVNLQVGQEMLIRCRNETGVTIPNGSVVYVTGASGNKPLIALADSTDPTKIAVVGMATEDIDHNSNGYVNSNGFVRGLNTLGMTIGGTIFLDESTPGGFTQTRPTAPNYIWIMGVVIAAHATEGVVYNVPTPGHVMMSMSDVFTEVPADGEFLVWNAANARFQLDATTPATVDIPKSFEYYIDANRRQNEESIHGGLSPLATAQVLNSGSPINITAGIGKILISIIAGSDVAGSITLTGDTVDRDTKAVTIADTEVIVIDAVTTDGSSTDSNGNVVHGFTGAYIASKWFKGAVVISTADVTLTDVDIYQVSFEQFGDNEGIVLNTLDFSGIPSNATAWSNIHIYSLQVTDSKCDIVEEASVEIDAADVTADKPYRLREGLIAKALDGTTDGIWVDQFLGPLNQNYWEDISGKIWYTQTITVDGTLAASPPEDLSDYLYLPGRSGGQTAYGGIDASDNLVLESTAHATKGDVIFQPNGGNVHIGSSTPNVASQLSMVSPAGLAADLSLFTTDGDRTDWVALNLYGYGQIGSLINHEKLWIHWDTADLVYKIESEAQGSATLRPLVLQVEGNSNQLYLAIDGKIGINIAVPDGTVHIHTASAGAVTADVQADDLVIENDGNAGISILSPDANASQIRFGSPADNFGARLSWNYNASQLLMETDKTGGFIVLKTDDQVEAMRILSDGTIAVGITDGDGTFHIHSGSAGAVTAPVSGDELVVENSGNAGISILTPNDALGSIFFGDPEDNDEGLIQFDHFSNRLVIATGGSNLAVLPSGPYTDNDSFRIATTQSPASGGTGTTGEIAWANGFLYVCVATNTWQRVVLTGGY